MECLYIYFLQSILVEIGALFSPNSFTYVGKKDCYLKDSPTGDVWKSPFCMSQKLTVGPPQVKSHPGVTAFSLRPYPGMLTARLFFTGNRKWESVGFWSHVCNCKGGAKDETCNQTSFIIYWHFRSCGKPLAKSNFILLGLMFQDQTILSETCRVVNSSSLKNPFSGEEGTMPLVCSNHSEH